MHEHAGPLTHAVSDTTITVLDSMSSPMVQREWEIVVNRNFKVHVMVLISRLWGECVCPPQLTLHSERMGDTSSNITLWGFRAFGWMLSSNTSFHSSDLGDVCLSSSLPKYVTTSSTAIPTFTYHPAFTSLLPTSTIMHLHSNFHLLVCFSKAKATCGL